MATNLGHREDGEALIPLSRAAKLFPKRNGKSPHLKTLHRRIRRGSRGVRLRAVYDGEAWYTTAAWVRQYLDAATTKRLPDGLKHPAAASEDHATAVIELAERWGI